ncbi:hypothetical protein JAAARDRAFT_162894 [Jaapia argillacea MUCL 33604]|uniref:Pali-domain-containing protein n=1 Tax=Jaapia argillacea MUCL 33604 TaxID=933084 RepID=A0A067PC32_9AGAM|nr:hypothetical protein JAAARDRAFT_162894 [Jaapia argillacea MUCL 33604]
MAYRTFCIPGVFFIFSAFVLMFITSISLPYLTGVDFVRVHFNGGGAGAGSGTGSAVSQLRFGIWAYCFNEIPSGNRVCSPSGHAYSVSILSPTQNNTNVIIGPSWTRGLAIHPVATGVIFIALLLSFSTHITVTLIASLVAFLAALLTLIAFACDIALYAYVKHQVGKLPGVSESTITGPGFWLTFVSFLLLLLAGCTVCFGRRRDRMAGATSYSTTKRPFWSRFRR